MKTTTQLQTTGNATITKATVLASLTLGLFLLAGLPPTAQADPLDKKSPKIAHRVRTDVAGHLLVESSGMYRDRGKSSPKIAHGMYRALDKSSPKIAHGMDKGLSDGIYILNFEAAIFLALEMGEFEIADALLEDLVELNAPIWEGGGGFNMRR